MANVLLLRQPSEDVADIYEDHFRNAGYYSVSLPALETSHENLTILSNVVRGGLKVKGINGVIMTSQRSCEALGKAFRLLNDEDQSTAGISGTQNRRNTVIGEMKHSLQNP
jgi:uroporphyrinogen-III synthase